MTKANEFRINVIRPVLDELGKGGDAAEELLLGTAVQESLNFKYRRQMAGGPARSFFQMEPATHDDIWKNYLKYKKDLSNKVASFLSRPDADKLDELENNDRYAVAMARVHYMRKPDALPNVGDVDAQANYWKQHYNTVLGKGHPHEYVEKWRLYVNNDPVV